MTFVFIISAVAAIVTALLVVPLTAKRKDMVSSLISLAVLTFIVLAIVYYMTNLDRNWLALWPIVVLATLAGTVLSKGVEQKAKGILFLASLVMAIYMLSASVWNADEKFEVAKMDEQVEIEAFDETKTPASVPPKFARNKMKKAFGQVPNTSYYELGNLQIQKVKDEYVYIAPVEFSGFFKWWNGDVTPGYFTMSATDSSDNPEFIEADMSYTPSSYFHKNLERHMRMKHPTKIFYGDVQLEIDEDGKPYYIRSYGKFISARNGFDVEGIVVVDPATGQTDAYALADVPAFIDGAVSPETVSLQNSYYGKYIHGFMNSLFGKKDVKLPSDEGTEANVSPIFGEDGKMYYFTDFTSPKEGVDSMLGYSLTDGRTGKATYYTGNLEDSYMDSQGALQIIEKKFIEKKWQGEMPVLYNFYGEASWLTPVLDSNGFLQNYFIVSAANPEISVYGNTPNEALKLYKTAIQRGGSSVDGSSNAEEKSVAGTVVRVFKERIGDFTQISFLLDNKQNYIVSSEVAPLAVYMAEGDNVQIKFLNTGELFLPVKELTIQGIEQE
ncbi:sulfite exporter TauE/SafE family protein [Bacillus sp. FJAT-22090]|uniref:sulfite exporter TauE/SafE family protein n=1 Tax=Bacillus sp. FJAT-22090 TaxID=1581038 RepID=UPI0011A0A589|nr:sulfite exporter TauE/SafE family protein [Bacillus sp. FJAT-22090]